MNTSRGLLIVEEDFRYGLITGKVHCADVDVVFIKPIRPDNPLLDLPNRHITPHVAWAPRETRSRLMDIAVSNVRAFLAGNPVNVVIPTCDHSATNLSDLFPSCGVALRST